MEYFSVLGGLILLVIAGDKLVEGSVAVARHLRVSKLIIGITVVSFGTSAPELVVSIDAALNGVTDLALGNIVGSNIANILLVLGVPALFYSFKCDDSETWHSLSYMILASLLFIFLAFFGPLHIWQGAIMISLLIIFLIYSVRRARKTRAIGKDIDLEGDKKISTLRMIVSIILGLAGLIFGAHILVDGAVIIARTMGISEAVIGLTIIAIGTSLPELVTSLMAARNGHGEVAMGNIIGSNLFNILAVMGFTSLVAPIAVQDHFFRLDFPVMMITALMLVPLALGKIRINRITGTIFTLLYILYLLYLAAQSNLI